MQPCSANQYCIHLFLRLPTSANVIEDTCVALPKEDYRLLQIWRAFKPSQKFMWGYRVDCIYTQMISVTTEKNNQIIVIIVNCAIKEILTDSNWIPVGGANVDQIFNVAPVCPVDVDLNIFGLYAVVLKTRKAIR